MPTLAAPGASALYLSYDGICDPLGRSQILPYVTALAARGHRISIISFEKAERTQDERREVGRLFANAGIEWHPLRYHKSPPVLSTLYDLALMLRLARRLNRFRQFDLVHCRSDVPGLVGQKLKRSCGTGFLFDMRGFWADERRDSGAWKPHGIHGKIYRFFKSRERQFWREADRLVSLTEAGRDAILAEEPGAAPIDVIPCCVDMDLFQPADADRRRAAREILGIADHRRVLAYIGSLGGNYMLDEMLDFFRTLREREPGSMFLFITRTPASEILSASNARGVPSSSIIVRSADREQVPLWTAAADWGIAFKRPSYSAKACSPTKLGEMLALELPVAVNYGVGDVGLAIRSTCAGVLIDRFDEPSYAVAIEALQKVQPGNGPWREETRRMYALDRGVDRYDAIYRSIRDQRRGA